MIPWFSPFRQLMQLRNLIRRHKWRFRPLKRAVLPARRVKRLVASILRRRPTIERTRDYRGESFIAAEEIYPAAQVQKPVQLFSSKQTICGAVSEPAFLYHFKNIEFWGRYGGSIVTADHRLLADLSPEVWGVDNHPIFSKLALPRRRQLPGRTAIAVTPEAVGNYYHWLIDLLPRAALIRSSGCAFDRLLINGSRSKYEQDSLTALGLPPGNVSYVNERDRFEIEEAFVPSMDHAAPTIAPWKIDLLHKLRDSISLRSDSPRRIYISRRRAAVRRLINEAEIVELLKAANFSFVELDHTPWNEQVALFRNAEAIVAPHGAALANIAFCEPGTSVTEIATRGGYKDFYLQLASAAKLRYQLLEAEPRLVADTDSSRAIENEDMTLNVDAARKVVEGWL